MSAHVLLNLLNKLEKEIKFEACSKFNKFKKTGTQMLDSIYLMTLKLLLNRLFGMKKL